MKKTIVACLAISIVSFVFLRPAEATLYDATADFSIDNGNPNGVWSYGWMPTDFSVFNPYTASRINQLAPQWSRDNSGDFTPMIWRIDGTTTIGNVAPGQLALHPSNTFEASVLRWTAETNGTYDILGQFLSGDGGIMQVGIRQGLDWLWQSTDSGAFDFDNTLTAGQSVDFLVYGGYGAGNTPLELTISSQVPEPTSILLFGVGIFGLGGMKLKQRSAYLTA